MSQIFLLLKSTSKLDMKFVTADCLLWLHLQRRYKSRKENHDMRTVNLGNSVSRKKWQDPQKCGWHPHAPVLTVLSNHQHASCDQPFPTFPTGQRARLCGAWILFWGPSLGILIQLYLILVNFTLLWQILQKHTIMWTHYQGSSRALEGAIARVPARKLL